MAKEAAHLVLLGVGLCLFLTCASSTSCIDAENVDSDPTAPSLTIKTIEFPNEDVIRVGSNVTIECISNLSKTDYGSRYNAQPYWMQFYYNGKTPFIKKCGGRTGGVDSEDSKVCTFFIQNATENDSGVYSCWAYNQMACTKGKIKLDFKAKSAPIFVSNPPSEIYVSAGGNANWTCETSGFPIPVVTWYKDGIRVPRKNITEMKGLSVLTVEEATEIHQGEYWCEARNSEGWKRSPSTILSLKRMPTILLHPKNVSVYLEGNVTMVSFSCKATGSPPPVIGWLKNNSTEANGTVIQTGSISSLILILVKKEKTAGTYNCVAKNSAGEAYSSEGTLVIFTQGPNPEAFQEKLSFYRHPKSITVSPGDQVVFTCAVEGSPVPMITWLKDGMKSVHGKAEAFQGKESSISVLTISSVEEQHVGTYACQATNAMGKVASKKAKLSLTGDISTPFEVSKLMWILVGVAAVLLVVVVILIFVIYNKHKKAAFQVTTNEMEEQRCSNLYVNEDTISQQLIGIKSCAAPRYQMKNMATNNAA